jgi:hypothetical protein
VDVRCADGSPPRFPLVVAGEARLEYTFKAPEWPPPNIKCVVETRDAICGKRFRLSVSAPHVASMVDKSEVRSTVEGGSEEIGIR